MTALDYISNEYARGYVHSRSHSREGVFVSLEFIDLCNGNMYDAILFSQIMYWHEPSNKTGDTRMRRERDGHLWVAKNHSDWYAECRIKAQTVRKCLDRLKQSGLIIYELHGEKGNKTPFIRINWDVFAAKMKAMETDKKVIPIPDITEHTPVIPEQGGVYSVTDPLLQHNEPNTENTTENTTELTTADEPQVKSVTPQNPVLAKVVALYEQHVGVLTINELNLLKEDSLIYSLDEWHSAIESYKRQRQLKLADGKGNITRPYKYILGILKNEKSKVDDIKAKADAVAQAAIDRTIMQYEEMKRKEAEAIARADALKAEEGGETDEPKQRAS